VTGPGAACPTPDPDRERKTHATRSRGSIAMFIAAGALVALGGIGPALALLAVTGALYIPRSPDRMLDAASVAVFCSLGYLAG